MSITPCSDPWSRLRFLVVGPLLAAPPAAGELRAALEAQSQKEWIHPSTGLPTRFAFSTIERWFYQARAADQDPIAALRRQTRRDRGRFLVISAALAETLRAQHRDHPGWSVKLHRDNLEVRVREDESLAPLPSYSTLRRYMGRCGLKKIRRRKGRAGEARARARLESREVRSYEVEHVHGLWHLDFHHGSRKILAPSGKWLRPILLAVLDDRSRLICHAQWFLDETAQSLVHGLIQAMLKRGLPRSLMSDNGAAMTARETTQGLERLGILHQTTLAYSPHQNGKQEVFWGQVEGRLIAMLEGEPDLSLALLNQATQAWIEREYQRSVHSETRQTPRERWLAGPSVGRPAPSIDELRLAFTDCQQRVQRRSDGTISVQGRRFEVPDRLRHLRRLSLRFAGWDLRQVWIVDPHTGAVLERCVPLDRAKNADRFRRPRQTPEPEIAHQAPPTGIAPLLRHLMQEYAATGLPPAYLPTEQS